MSGGGGPTVESVSAEWTSVPEAQVGDTIAAEGKAEATLSDGTTEPADSAHVLWRDSLIHRAENQTSIETEVAVQSGEEGELVLRAFASGTDGEATRTLMPEEVVTGAAAEWTSVPSVAGDTVVAKGKALAVFSDGSTQAADSAEVRWRGETVRRVEEKKTVQARIPTETGGAGELVLRAFASDSEEEATETVQVDRTAPALAASATELDGNYGHVRLTVEADEPADISAYLLGPSGEDSTEVLSETSIQMLDTPVQANRLGNQIGEMATLSVEATDEAGNTARDTARGVVEGWNITFSVDGVSPDPGEGLVPLSGAYVSIKQDGETTIVQTNSDGTATVENLAEETFPLLVADDQIKNQIGGWYNLQDTVEANGDLDIRYPLLPNVQLPPSDYNNFLKLMTRLLPGQPDPPGGFTKHVGNRYSDVPPEPFKIWIHPDTLSGKFAEEWRQVIEEEALSWNGRSGQYNHVSIVQDSSNSNFTLYAGPDQRSHAERKNSRVFVQVITSESPDEREQTFGPSASHTAAAHEVGHMLGFFHPGPPFPGPAKSNFSMAWDPASKPSLASSTEVKIVHVSFVMNRDVESIPNPGQYLVE